MNQINKIFKNSRKKLPDPDFISMNSKPVVLVGKDVVPASPCKMDMDLEGSLSTVATEFSPDSTASTPEFCVCRKILKGDNILPPPFLPANDKDPTSSSSTSSLPVVPELRSSLKRPGKPSRSASLVGRGEVEVWLPHKKEPLRRRSCIIFDENVRVKKVPPVNQLMDNYKDLWFNHEDYEHVRQKNKRLIYRTENNLTGGRSYCVRGLEGMMKKDGTARLRAQDRYMAQDAVLDEQDVQAAFGKYDDERIASAYRLASIRSKLDALRRASLDEKEANIVLSAITMSTSTD